MSVDAQTTDCSYTYARSSAGQPSTDGDPNDGAFERHRAPSRGRCAGLRGEWAGISFAAANQFHGSRSSGAGRIGQLAAKQGGYSCPRRCRALDWTAERASQLPVLSGNEHPAVAIGSVALVTICVALFTSVYLHAGSRVAVLTLARDVQQGHTITSDDLAVVRIAFSTGIAPIAADKASLVVGRTAAVSLLRGTLLSTTA